MGDVLHHMDACIAHGTVKRIWQAVSLNKMIDRLECVCALPSLEKMVLIMQKCTKEKDLVSAQRISLLIGYHGLEDDIDLGNHLVQMLAACGGLHDAQAIFDSLALRKEYAWTSLIQAYVDNGNAQKTLDLFNQLHEGHLCPVVYMFPAALKACAKLKHLHKGWEIHMETVAKGYESNAFVGNSLVAFYGKCGSLGEAQEVFKKQGERNTVSWNALIMAYANLGRGEEALALLEQMQKDGVLPDAGTFVGTLKACGIFRTIARGRELHSTIVKEGWDKVSLIGTCLVDMYAKCGVLDEARGALDLIANRTLFSWTALMSGYAEHGPALEALNCINQMQEEGLYPDAIAFVCCLKTCGSVGASDKCRQVHADVVRAGLEKDLLVANMLVDIYAKSGFTGEAQKVFDELSVHSVVTWTALIAAYTEHGHGGEVLRLLQQMQMECVLPNAATYACSFKACGSIGAIDRALKIHAAMAADHFSLLASDLNAVNSEHGREFSAESEASFKELMGGRDPLTEDGSSLKKLAGALVDMYSKCGCMVYAQWVLKAMPATNLVVCNALVTGYARRGEFKHVLGMLYRMERENIVPDGVTFLGILTTCSHVGLFDLAYKYYNMLSTDFFLDFTVEHCNCMVDLFGRAGLLEEAMAMLENIPFQPNLVSFGSMLSGCRTGANVGVGRLALEYAAAWDNKLASVLISISNIFATAHMWEHVEVIRDTIQVSKAWPL